MFQEPVRFLEDMMRNNRSILDILYGLHLRQPRAGHPLRHAAGGRRWKTLVRVDDAAHYRRGGILPMAVFQTQNAPGLRTSPVKRGFWVVHRVLGETIPPPPPVVPELPADEAKADLPLPEMLARHRSNPSAPPAMSNSTLRPGVRRLRAGGRGSHQGPCRAPRGCPGRFPGALKDRARGRPEYIREHREADFVDNFSRKLLAYALNRSLDHRRAPHRRHENPPGRDGFRFDTMVEAIVTSRQFPNQRRTRRSPGEMNDDDTRTSALQRRKGITRRAILRGAGVTMALPWLASLSAFRRYPAPAAFPPAPTLRRDVPGQRHQRGSLERRKARAPP